MHILLVEDDDRIAAALRPALHRHGMTTRRLATGRGAVDHLGGVDVVLLDLGLPDIDGVDVCRAIREVSDVPVIVVSARGEVDDRILGLHSGADDYASLAEGGFTEADLDGLEAELARYDETYDVAVLVLDVDRAVVASSRRPVPVLDEAGMERVGLALANRRSETYPLLMPWDPQPLVLAEPVLVNSGVRGVAVTVSPTVALRAYEVRAWALLAGAALLALVLGVLVSLPVVRWILRPVRRLDEGTGRVAAAVLAGATPEPVADGTGPPELRRVVGVVRPHGRDGDAGLLGAARLRRRCEPPAAQPADRPAPAVVQPAWSCGRNGHRGPRRGIGGGGAPLYAARRETVLDAVLDNAVKFSPPGGAVSVWTTSSPGHVEVTVRDCGPGLPAEDLERATDRFWRSPAQSNAEGSGLGLAIAARTVELAGGELCLELPAGGGLQVVARFAQAPEEPSP